MIVFQRNQLDKITYHKRFFRPSCFPALNLRFDTWEFFAPFSDKTYDQIQIPAALTKTPEEALLNYFSILREAANLLGRLCGSVGQGTSPFPIAYNFLSKDYQKKLSFDQFVHLFAGVGHTSLIKLCRVPDLKGGIRFFYEIETIEGFEGKNGEYFGYYYGFIQLIQESGGYRIADIIKNAEDFLCAPYHGWDHTGEDVVDIKFGEWCKLIQKRYPTIKNGYIKNICFRGNDGADYWMIFFTLTNGTDVEIAQFRKTGSGAWKQIHIKPEEDCIGLKRE